MSRNSIETDLEIMLAAAGMAVFHLPRPERTRARRMMLKAFNLLQVDDGDEDALIQMLYGLVDVVERAGKFAFLATFADPGVAERRYSGLIKTFRGFILHPGQGLLTPAVEYLCQQAVKAVEDAPAAIQAPLETEIGGDASFELVRGEDGIEPDRS